MCKKHFTLARADGGVDSSFSLEPEELRNLVLESERAWSSLGEVQYGPTLAERKSLIFRRSIYVSKDIQEGDIFTTDNIRIIRPGDGAHPRLYSEILGSKATKIPSNSAPITSISNNQPSQDILPKITKTTRTVV